MPPSVVSSNVSAKTRQTILVIDDQEVVLLGTTRALEQAYPDAVIMTALTSQAALQQLEHTSPDVAVVDLSMPENTGGKAQTEVGIQLLKSLLERYPNLNIVVQSAHIPSLVRLKPAINLHRGGFTVADKGLPLQEMLARVDWAMQGVIYTPAEMRNGVEVKPEWLTVLQLAFEEGLTDKAIADRMKTSLRTIGNYWSHIRNALDVFPDTDQNVRSLTAKRAREEGLID